MLFSSPLFLLGFLPLFLAAWALTPRFAVNATILVASLAFYAWGEPVFAWVAVGSALLDLGLVAAMKRTVGLARRCWLAAAVGANLLLLAWFKYAGFAFANLDGLDRLLGGAGLGSFAPVALPIGVSFIVFEKITYVVDVYRRTGPLARPAGYLLYVLLFPKLLAGPIIKYHDIAPQLAGRPRRFDDLGLGLARFAVGLAKKVLIADPMGEIAVMAFGRPAGELGCGLAWLGAVAFSLQIFFDFSGYSDMAIGLARALGFRLMENFDRPYLSVGFHEFWRRWHISLSTWIRDYLYIPLGGSRVSQPRLFLNLWICFLASGLWHGAAWTFVLWGAWHGLVLTLERLFLGRWLAAMPRALGVALTWLLVTLGWVVFRAADLRAALGYLAAMAQPGRTSIGAVVITPDLWVTLAAGLALCFLPGLPPLRRLGERCAASGSWRTAALAGAWLLLVLSIARTLTVTAHPFLYFRF
ncbi:MAG: MBOAT family O-acyltransferase [Dongiaceae bacterium]